MLKRHFKDEEMHKGVSFIQHMWRRFNMNLFSGIFFIFVMPALVKGEVETCNEPVDIVFVIDTSVSIYSDHFKLQMKFIHDVVRELNVGPGEDQSQVAAVTFSSKFEVKFEFDDHQTEEDVLKAIDDIQHDQGDATRTYKGLDLVNTVIFAPGNGDRPNIPNIVVVVTDGETNSGSYDRLPNGGKDETLKEAEKLRKIATVFAVGIGDDTNLDKDELKGISGDPNKVIIATTYEELNTDVIKKELVDKTCEAAEQKEEAKDCKETKAEIMFLIDGSSSIQTQDTFNKELSFIGDLVNAMDVGPDKTRIGIIKFSTTPTVELNLQDGTDLATVNNVISNIKWTGGNTFLNLALEEMLKQMSLSILRPDTPAIVVLISDGISTRGSFTTQVVDTIHKTRPDLNIFGIGIGKYLDMSEIQSMVSKPVDTHAFKVNDQDALPGIRSKVQYQICQASELNDKEDQKDDVCKESMADIVFLIDSSSSINNQPTFDKELDFVSDIVNALNIGEKQTRIAVVQFSTEAKVILTLSQGIDKQSVTEKIKNIIWKGGNTYLNLALEEMLKVMSQDNLREGVPAIVALISDGVSTSRSKTKEMVELIKNQRQDLILIGIGIGKYLDMSEINSMVSEPIGEHAFQVDDQDALTNIRGQVRYELCQADGNAEKACMDKAAEIIFIADASTSIGGQAFLQLKSFLKSVVNNFNIGPNNIRIGLISFSTEAKTEFTLDTYRDADEVKKAIDAMDYTTGLTFTNLALEKMLDEGFKSAREDVPKIVIVVTDGESREPTKTMEESHQAKENNIIMFSIGVGPYLNKNELKEMASDPVDKHMFMVDDYASLEQIQNSVAYRACSSGAPERRSLNALNELLNTRHGSLHNYRQRPGVLRINGEKESQEKARQLALKEEIIRRFKEKEIRKQKLEAEKREEFERIKIAAEKREELERLKLAAEKREELERLAIAADKREKEKKDLLNLLELALEEKLDRTRE